MYLSLFLTNRAAIQTFSKRAQNSTRSLMFFYVQHLTGPSPAIPHNHLNKNSLEFFPKKRDLISNRHTHSKISINVWKVQLVARRWENGGKFPTAGLDGLFDDREKSVGVLKTFSKKLDFVSSRQLVYYSEALENRWEIANREPWREAWSSGKILRCIKNTLAL